ncbi:MAG: acetyl-CoA C-acetyltransferase, partial [Planctomycetota bacterium]|nr:acetyl-CoA C-acetyltransferase [Planctomycetota bacterium]
LIAGSSEIMVAGGMESMTNAPYILSRAREGYRLGHGDAVKDHMFLDGLEDAYQGKLMGLFAEQCAEHYRFTREEQDQFAIESLNRAKTANEDGSFNNEIVPITVKTRRGENIESRDEQPFRSNIQKIPQLRPAFSKTGTVTAANSSSISDGGAALVLMRQSTAEKQGLKPRARILG